MNKKELIAEVASKTGNTNKDTEVMVTAVLETIMEEVREGNKVSILGFGNFEPKTNPARKAFNPAKKEKIDVAESKTVKFKVGKSFKDSLN